MADIASAQKCFDLFSITTNCTILADSDNKIISVGGYGPGEFPGDPDIAGVGAVASFYGLSILILMLAVFLAPRKLYFMWKKLREPSDSVKDDQSSLESLVVALGDQQLLTGMAYFIAFGFGDLSSSICLISIYHLVIGSNILMLITSTNLVAVSITRRLWKEPLIGIIRMCFLTFVLWQAALTVAGIEPPLYTDPSILLPGVCGSEQSLSSGKVTPTLGLSQLLGSIFQRARQDRSGEKGIAISRLYIATLLWYILAGIADFATAFERWGLMRKVYAMVIPRPMPPSRPVSPDTPRRSRLRWILFGSTLVLHLGAWIIGVAGVASTMPLVLEFRGWLRNSEWVERENGTTAEDNAKTFGQLMAIFSLVAAVWAILVAVSEKFHKFRLQKWARNSSVEVVENADDKATGGKLPEHSKGLAI